MPTFTRLYPDRAEGLSAVDVASDLPGPIPDGRPFMCLNMIATADGRATVKGRAGTIANEADYQLFHATRARMDGILVGAETIRVESYGRAINSAEARERREREGRPADIVTVVATRSVSLPSDVGLLRAKENVVVMLTPSPDAELSDGAAATVRYLRDEDMVAGVRRLGTEHLRGGRGGGRRGGGAAPRAGLRLVGGGGRPNPHRAPPPRGLRRRAPPRLPPEARGRQAPADDPPRPGARPADRARAHHPA